MTDRKNQYKNLLKKLHPILDKLKSENKLPEEISQEFNLLFKFPESHKHTATDAHISENAIQNKNGLGQIVNNEGEMIDEEEMEDEEME